MTTAEAGRRNWRWAAPLLPTLYALGLAAFGRLGVAQLGIAIGCALLGYWGPRSRQLLGEVAPVIFAVLGYDAIRYVAPWFVSEQRVVTCGLRKADLILFGPTPTQTLGEFLSSYHTPLLDVFFAVPYTIFLYVALGYAAYLYRRDRPLMRRYLLAFGLANFMAFAAWLTIPAAPPWYVHSHGCGVDLAALPSPAGLARVDTLFGIHYFADFYSHAASVFGALPSMHCAYPMMSALTAFPTASPRARVLHVAYVIWMLMAALYLDHHWVLDALMGWTVALAAVTLARVWYRARSVLVLERA